MLKGIQLKPHRAASANTYEGTYEHSEIRQRVGRRQNTVPVDMRARTEGHQRRAHHRNGDQPVEGSSVLSRQPVRRTVKQLTADRSCLVSDVPRLVFLHAYRPLIIRTLFRTSLGTYIGVRNTSLPLVVEQVGMCFSSDRS
jgi:hypothetical protein